MTPATTETTERPPASRRRAAWLFPLLVLVAAIGVNANTLSLGFTWDDSWLILENERIDDPSYVHYLLFERTLWRPLKRLSLMLDYHLWGPEHPEGFHLTNVLLHAAACLALFAVLKRLTGRPRLALVASLLFAVHPVHVESIANISHRKEPMSLLFLLLAFLAWLWARGESPPGGLVARGLGALGLAGQRTRDVVARVECGVLAAVWFLLGMLSKEVGAVMFPVLVVTHELLLVPGAWRRRARQAGLAAAAAVPVLALFVWRGYLGSLLRRFSAEQILWITESRTSSYGDILLIAVKAFATSFQLLAWPWPLYLDRRFDIPHGVFDPWVLAGLALLVLVTLITWRTATRAPLVAFAVAWICLTLLPVLNVVPLTHWLVAERFLYVPSVGWCLLVALGLEAVAAGRLTGLRADQGRRVAWGALVLLGLLHAGLTVMQNRVWTSSETLWSHTLRYNQGSYRAQYGVGLELSKDGRSAEAEDHYRKTLAINASYPEANYALGLLLLQEGRNEEAISWAEKHARLKTNDPESYMVIGNARFGLRQWDLAAEAYRQAVARAPRHVEARFNLANVLSANGRHEEALLVLEEAVRLRPNDPGVQSLLGDVTERLGRDATAVWTRALELDPDSRTCLNGLARALVRIGERRRARSLLERSLAIDPSQKAPRELADWLDAQPQETTP